MRFITWTILLLMTAAFAAGQTNKKVTPVSAVATKVDIKIKLAHGDETEKAAEKQLRRLMRATDVSKWVFTKTIVIDSGDNVVPQSHPVLTLDTGGLRDDDLVLSTFVHEQMHWYVNTKPEKLAAAIKELKDIYPQVPVGYPDGARNEESTYNHLLVCYLENEANKIMFGYLRAANILNFLVHDHYRWVYKMVQDEPGKIGRIIRKYDLGLPK